MVQPLMGIIIMCLSFVIGKGPLLDPSLPHVQYVGAEGKCWDSKPPIWTTLILNLYVHNQLENLEASNIPISFLESITTRFPGFMSKI